MAISLHLSNPNRRGDNIRVHALHVNILYNVIYLTIFCTKFVYS